MFTGDLEKNGFAALLRDQSFKDALEATNVYIASHHSRESGCPDDVAVLLTKVYYVIISDKDYEHETQETLSFYSKVACGGPFRKESKRRVLTTRNDGRIAFNITDKGWSAYD